MYNQYLIDSINEKNLYDLLDGKTNYTFDIHNQNSKDIRYYFVFQHFVIKAFSQGYNKEACIKYLKMYYNDFYNNPHLFCDSPLISDKTLDLIFKDSENKNRIKEFRNKYYNSKEINILYNKRKTQELTEPEKNRFYSYLIILLKNNDKKYEKILEKEIEKIINSDFKKLTDIELKFYCQYVAQFALQYKDFKATVMIGTDSSSLYGYQFHDYIFINKDGFGSFDTIDKMTETVCHESRHSVQEHESKGKDTLTAFEMTQHALFAKYLNSKSYDFYHKNYHFSTIELDAEHHGHFDAGVFFTMFKNGDLAEKVRQDREDVLDRRNDYCFMLDENNKARTIDDFIVTNLDKIILDNPSELDNYPVLKNIYNLNGTKKSFEELINGKVNEGIDKRGLYDNYINYGIANNELDNIPIDRIKPEKMKVFVESLSSVYRGYIIELKKYFRDDRKSLNPKQVEFTTNNKLLLSYKLLSYIDNNYEQINNSINTEHFNNQHPIFKFLIDLRDLDINSITNESIKNNQLIVEKIKKLKELTDNIISKFNKTYMDKRMDKIPEDIRNCEMFSSNGMSITFEDYFKKFILPRMDGHQEVTINNSKYYVGDLIRYYVNNMKKDEVKEENNMRK